MLLEVCAATLRLWHYSLACPARLELPIDIKVSITTAMTRDAGRAPTSRLLFVALLLLVSGCAELAYYRQSAAGQLDVMRRTQSVEAVLASGSLTGPEAGKLELVQSVRGFAASEMGMSFNASYTRYVNLGRNYVVRNLVAAPEFSTHLHTWCYPIIGCASYRGFFDQVLLAEEIADLEDDGFDTYAYDVTAYSTLGWFTDPVIHTFLQLPDHRLVELILHELSHQQLYVNGDSDFNESFATAVARAGTTQYLGSEENVPGYETPPFLATVRAEIASTRTHLQTLYAQPLENSEKRIAKNAVFSRLQDTLRSIALQHDASAQLRYLYEEPLNNARLGIMATYSTHVPAFMQLLEHAGGNFPRFFEHSHRLAALPAAERSACLEQWRDAGLAQVTSNCW